MSELIRRYSQLTLDRGGRAYACAVYGEQRNRGGWEGRLVFFPIDGGPVIATGRETSQPRRTYLRYWADGLSLTFLQGALVRALDHGESWQPKPDVTTRKPARTRHRASGSALSISIGSASPSADAEADPLATFTSNLTERAQRGELDPLIGRAVELEALIQVLSRRRKNNAVLVGDAGVGKTAIVEGLALAIAQGRVSAALEKATLYALDLGGLLAGTKLRGQFEERMTAMIAALQSDPDAILFIDEIHGLVGAGTSAESSLDASNLLKPALAMGLRCIGSTTFSEYRNWFERDAALRRRFQKIDIREPSPEETVRILDGVRSRYEEHHRVRFSDESLHAAVHLSVRFLRDRPLPDKAIDLLDETGAAKRLALGPARSGIVSARDIEAVVARTANVPAQTISLSDDDRMRTLEPALKQVIFGQDTAVETLVATIKLARAGLRPADKPCGSLLFSGPTGVGKTELAKQLAQALAVPFLRFDMSEFMDKHMVARLIGAPPGYVGFEQGGLLTDAVRKNPHAVLLLDEIEKAHPDVHDILLQVMDHATLTDNFGRHADFQHVILILTTNAGGRELAKMHVGFTGSDTQSTRERSKDAIERTFSPEFRNRLDAWIAFDPLTPDAISKVVEQKLGELTELLAAKGVGLMVSPAARRWLAEKGFDSVYGARPLARLIQDRIGKPLADMILFGRLAGGGAVRVQARQDELHLVASRRRSASR